MKITFVKVEPRKDSISPELVFTFEVTELDTTKMPIQIQGELFSEDNCKIGDLLDSMAATRVNLWLNACDNTNSKTNYPYQVKLCCPFSEKVIDHIEEYRVNKKTETKDIVFNAHLNVLVIEANMQIASIHLEEKNDSQVFRQTLFYKYEQDPRPVNTDMWLLSAYNGANFLNQNRCGLDVIKVRIDLMDWINQYTQYFSIGKFLVFEFLQPDKHILEGSLAGRYEKAQQAIEDMRKQLNYGEWKQAVIASRPVFELFKDFTDLRKLLIDSGYSESAYGELKNSIQSFFDFVSKFHHGLKKGNVEINEDIPTEKEDAYIVYSNSVSILYLVSQKIKRIQ